ncbi:MAG TPA: HAD-IC family P-type ATPase [Candidatus Bathyarchaeia archaeon]|nr:HAD-IC family P-type ATPase [Candidatus Bathyarchaeia archaeon]
MVKVFKEFACLAPETVLSKLQTRLEGLSAEEAERRLIVYGKNEFGRKKGRVLKIFFRQINNAFFYLLLAACFIALLLRDVNQLVTIGLIVVISSVLGFIQEYRSEKTMEKLRSFISSKCLVKRGGKAEEVDKKNLVPGEIVVLEKGDIVPADIRILHQENLSVDESILTGESKTLEKNTKALSSEPKTIFEAENILFSGSKIISGMAEGVVIATAKKMELGKMAALVKEKKGKSNFEKNIDKISKFILWLAVISLLLIFVINLILKGTGVDIPHFLLFVMALSVGLVPEGLPLVCLITMSSGALQLAKKRVVVKRLSSIEDLGNIEVLCLDKTGTLTENRMVLDRVVSKNEKGFWEYFLAACLPIKEKYKELKSSFDRLLFEEATKNSKPKIKSELIREEPFNANKREDRTVIKFNKENFLIVKGAAELLLKESSFYLEKDSFVEMKGSVKKFYEKALKKAGEEGKRVYGMAVKKIQGAGVTNEKDLCFLGFVVLKDPLKATAIEAVEKAKEAGIEIKILTGDSLEVAFFVAQKIGLAEKEKEVVLGSNLEGLNGREFENLVAKTTVFARVTPEEKYRIVKALKKDKIVGFMGDGVNDVPALKLADVALVVDTAADIAKEAADIILLKKDLRTLVNGVKFGRGIFNNILKYIKVTLSSNFGNCYSLALISLFIPFLPMLPNQILLVNLLSDLPLSAVSLDSNDKDELIRPAHLNLREIGNLILFLGTVSSFFDFLFFALFRKLAEGLLQSLWFEMSVLTEILFVFSLRTKKWFWRGERPSKWLVFISGGVIILTLIIPFSFLAKEFLFIRPQAGLMVAILSLVCLYFITTELIKVWYYKKLKNKI